MHFRWSLSVLSVSDLQPLGKVQMEYNKDESLSLSFRWRLSILRVSNPQPKEQFQVGCECCESLSSAVYGAVSDRIRGF